MKQILYDDNNNNASYLINILVQVQQQIETPISWELSEFDFSMLLYFKISKNTNFRMITIFICNN